MTTFKYSSITWIFVLMISCAMIGCQKFPFMKNEDMPSTASGTNLREQSIWKFLQEDHSTDFTSIDLFARAVKHAGLEDILDGKDDYTIIISNNTAITGMLALLGPEYQKVEDVPSVVLRNILSDNIIKGRVRSFDLAENENKKAETINGGFLFFKREPVRADIYRMYINKDTSITVTPPLVRTQNLEFSNGVAHVVPTFTYYRLKTPATSVITTPPQDLQTENVVITKDATLQYGSLANTNLNDPAEIFFKTASTLDGTRAGLMQFPVKQPAFGRIGSVKLYCYYWNSNTNNAMITSIYQASDENWDENAVTLNNGPKLGAAIASFSIQRTIQTIPNWYSYDISAAYLQSLKTAKPFINLGINQHTGSNLKIRPREYQAGRWGAYIVLTSAPPTILTAGNNKGITVSPAKGFYTLTTEDLSLNGTSSNNVIYKVEKPSVNGYFVKYGIPLKETGEFSQADIEKGGIKYVYGGQGTTDQMILEPRDHQGGYYPSLINVNVEIR